MLQYHVAFHLPRGEDRMVVAEVLDFPGVVSQGFDLADDFLAFFDGVCQPVQEHSAIVGREVRPARLGESRASR